jgi:hypothetical protein
VFPACTLTFWTQAGSETTGHTHIPSLVLMGELSSSNHIAIACHYRGNPAGGPPSRGSPAPAQPRPGCRRRHTGADHGAGSPALSRGARSALAHTHAPRTRGRTPGSYPGARTPHTRAQAYRIPATDCGVGGGHQWSSPGRAAGSPEGAAGRPAPPRSAPRTRQAGRVVGCKVSRRKSAKAARWLGLGCAPRRWDGSDRWPGFRRSGCTANPAAVPARISVPSVSRPRFPAPLTRPPAAESICSLR